MKPHEDLNAHVKRAKKLLFKTLNCCESQIIPFQERLGVKYDQFLQASTGLAGGLYNQGSTCGVIFGTALNFALLRYEEKKEWTRQDEKALLQDIQKYVNWFQATFQATLCRDRTGLDFTTTKGKIGLLIPSKAKGCIKQTEESIKYFFKTEKQATDQIQELKENTGELHCAREVFQRFREQTNEAYPLLEQLAIIFDGGIAFTGNTCGALTAGIMILGLQYRGNYTFSDAGKIRSLFRSFPPEFTRPSSALIKLFREKYGTLECSEITHERFSDWEDFQEKTRQLTCNNIIEEVSEFLIRNKKEK